MCNYMEIKAQFRDMFGGRMDGKKESDSSFQNAWRTFKLVHGNKRYKC